VMKRRRRRPRSSAASAPARSSDPPIGTTEQFAVAVLGHPLGALKVSVECPPGASGFALRVNVQNDPRNLAPVGAVGVRVEEAQIRHEVLPIVAGECGTGGRDIGDIGIKRRRVKRKTSARGEYLTF
jgi:hypothetical protein